MINPGATAGTAAHPSGQPMHSLCGCPFIPNRFRKLSLWSYSVYHRDSAPMKPVARGNLLIGLRNKLYRSAYCP